MANVVESLFSNPGIRRALFRVRYVLGPLLLVPLGWAMHPGRLPLAIGVSLFGQLIQTWCFASLVKNRELTARGPYLLSRNPMYLGRWFMFAGFVLLLGEGIETWLLLAVYTVVYYLYMDNRIKREEKRLNRLWGEAYADYCRRVPRLIPSPRNLSDPALWYWDWAPFRENNAHWNILGTLLAYLVIWLVHTGLPRP